ncbi:arsenic resistance N-acetyltransferase ArsN2 [Sphingomonas palmae]|nr:arsenic resistance N-acetyltransferase ArsN2 [Sphingomonas palmae]
MTDLTFTDVPRGEYDVMRLQLEMAGLPTDDLDGPDRLFFRLSDGHGPVGYIGLEGNGPDRLLRSLVVMRRHRGHGHGRELVRRLGRVCDGAVKRLHLLTTGAAPFFRSLGFVDAERGTAPQAIAYTSQFTSLCPSSAIYLVKDIA